MFGLLLGQQRNSPELQFAIAPGKVVVELARGHTAPDHSELNGRETSRFRAPILVGYGYARQNDPHGISDAIPENPDARIYRHPLSAGQSPEERQKYRPRFDLFSLGMVLIEVALWKPLRTVVPHIFRLVNSQQDFDGIDILNEIGKAIRLCLDPKDFPRPADSDQEVDVDAYLEVTVSLQEAILTSPRESISFFTESEIAVTI
ncbi:hypothetical protein LTS15_000076 [Exophiala xenobiotica]|nr:hypothetical protein LTS15_000076 [Exophiala xenobiotica]